VGKPYLLLDRDGTLIVEKNYLSDPSDVEFYEGIPEALQKVQRAGWGILVLTNQSGIGRELMGLHDMQAVNNRIQELLCPLDVRIDAFYYCPHLPNAGCQCRKPNRGMVDQAIQDFGFDPTQAIVVGDKSSDVELGHRIGAKSVLVRTGYGLQEEELPTMSADHVIDSLADLPSLIGSIYGQCKDFEENLNYP
jgi:D-glycero-D-manno-heptose 1,7-bisphosphate phosphatase